MRQWEEAGGAGDGAARGVGGCDIRGVQGTDSCKHAVEARGAGDGASRGAGGGNIMRVYVSRHFGFQVCL